MTDSDPSEQSKRVGAVLGTQPATPLEWWVAIDPEAYLQLDDVVAVRTEVPARGAVSLSGVVDMVRSQHEGSHFESDVFLAEQGVLPLQVARSAHVVTTRVEPEVWVPPVPGDAVARVQGAEREIALHFDTMDQKLACGLSRDGQPIYLDLAYLDGRRGAHVNISGISGVATKTTFATFLLYSLFNSGALGHEAANTKALIFNVKGEDLLFLDKPNRELSPEEAARYAPLGLTPGEFRSVGIWAPVRRQGPAPDTGSRSHGVIPFYWTVRDVVRDRLLRFLFAEAGDERSQVADLLSQVEAALDREAEDVRDSPATVRVAGVHVQSFADLCDLIEARLDGDNSSWSGRIASGTISAFLRRLQGARHHCGHLIRGAEADKPDDHRIDWTRNQVSVIDINKLHDRAKRFVVGVVVKRLFEDKERTGSARPLVFLVLDELNKYAPREGWSPISEILLDIAERGRSLGVILIGAQQTASEVERRVVANAAIRVVGRLDSAESGRAEYGFLTDSARQRSVLLKPGTMLVQQPRLPVALEASFPFPSWATRVQEAGDSPEEEDPFSRFD